MTKQETLQERSARLNQAALKDTKDYATESYYKGFSMNKPKEQTPAVPKITLEHGKTYVTAGGERVTVKAHTDSFTDFYKFKGDNNYRYGLNGDFHPLCYSADNKHIIISEYKEPQVQPKSYTAKELLSAMSDSYNNGKSYGRIFSTSELQSLTKMQSKVITALEAEILELKETANYLSHNPNSRVQELRKKIYNEITTKKKRLAKLVELQARMKRSK